IFDFSYVIGGGNGFIRHSQTVAIVSLGLEIPSFYLTKKTFIHRLGSYRDIDFEFAQNFSKNYHLLGSDEEAIRKLFSSNILTFFEGLNPKYTVEAINGELAIFLPNKKIKPVEIDNFVQKVSQIATVFHRALERSSN
ncbi:MAG: hypothetical protein KKF89_01845, partial [Nanoarchaeota archaeon]|nr:hypothetical protein [Nanoarchaeota archaeon]